MFFAVISLGIQRGMRAEEFDHGSAVLGTGRGGYGAASLRREGDQCQDESKGPWPDSSFVWRRRGGLATPAQGGISFVVLVIVSMHQAGHHRQRMLQSRGSFAACSINPPMDALYLSLVQLRRFSNRMRSSEAPDYRIHSAPHKYPSSLHPFRSRSNLTERPEKVKWVSCEKPQDLLAGDVMHGVAPVLSASETFSTQLNLDRSSSFL
uniref:Uncharacterized protein n=1 Tax=Compsopogon caeruleus TaxID=31354 RepID=A0A6T6C3U0_9RHOD|mmetsp:Transcript_17058/g.35491  ORF Transcript_17058/g.35491 Transcript_17058/m.35491 type:complete len:208 (+) Transcript_17058:393-1016(+)